MNEIKKARIFLYTTRYLFKNDNLQIAMPFMSLPVISNTLKQPHLIDILVILYPDSLPQITSRQLWFIARFCVKIRCLEFVFCNDWPISLNPWRDIGGENVIAVSSDFSVQKNVLRKPERQNRYNISFSAELCLDDNNRMRHRKHIVI